MMAANSHSNYTGGTPGSTTLRTRKLRTSATDLDLGSRTRWHSHETGQIQAGETTYLGPGVVHWHEGAPDQGGVTDAEFKAKPRR
jgi:quercetin dioxygenase-like cupin family protein